VKVWDPRQKDEPVANMEPGTGQDRRDCWCVAFGMVPQLKLNTKKSFVDGLFNWKFIFIFRQESNL
jgi:hypothetical protein